MNSKKTKKSIKKLASSFDDELKKNMLKSEFKKAFHSEMVKLQLADEIIRFRKKKKISQKELAEKINTTQAVISRIENGQVFPGTANIQRICNEYNVRAEIKFV